MLLTELFINEAGVGIITKQNTTPDVKPGEVQRQAAKLGMKIDRKGRPPLAHKTAAKNTSANKAYNIGLVTEGKELYDGKLPIVSLITALALALSTPQVSAQDTAKDAYDLARQIYKAKDMTSAGAKEEATQEIKNILRTIQGHPNQSKIIDIFKNTMKEDIEVLGEHIRKEGNKYTVYSKNGKRKFGTYTSKADAEKRLRQIEMFKHMG